MKKIRYIHGIMGCLIIAMTAGLFSCSSLEDELFTKSTYIVHNGWKDYSLEVADDNTTILPVYFGVNGTSGNDKNIQLTMEVYPDTLAKYNWEKYKNQQELYYKILPEGSYTFDATSWTIPSGELNSTAYIKIDLNQIKEEGSLYSDYVLPLRLTSSTGEPLGLGKYTKVLAHISFKNDYSGTYSGKGVVKQIGTSYTTEITSTQLYAINNSTCYMFVGEKTRANTADHLNYVVEIERDVFGVIKLSAPTVPGLKFKPLIALMSRKYTYNYVDQRYYTEITTVKLTYEYQDLTAGEPIMMSFDGEFSMTRDVLRVDYPGVDVEE